MDVDDLLEFASEAELEIDEAAAWYAAQFRGPDLHRRFLAELERVARQVAENPSAWTEIEPGVRRAVLRRFPYALIYLTQPSGVLVLAVAHHSRREGYWRDRRP